MFGAPPATERSIRSIPGCFDYAAPMLFRSVALRAAGLALCLSLLGTVCGACGQGALGVMPGVVNDPGNLSLRRAILAFATSQLCSEMRKRSVPLRLRDDDPVTGRFYPGSCVAQELANGNLFLQFGGSGVVWTICSAPPFLMAKRMFPPLEGVRNR